MSLDNSRSWAAERRVRPRIRGLLFKTVERKAERNQTQSPSGGSVFPGRREVVFRMVNTCILVADSC